MRPIKGCMMFTSLCSTSRIQRFMVPRLPYALLMPDGWYLRGEGKPPCLFYSALAEKYSDSSEEIDSYPETTDALSFCPCLFLFRDVCASSCCTPRLPPKLSGVRLCRAVCRTVRSLNIVKWVSTIFSCHADSKTFSHHLFSALFLCSSYVWYVSALWVFSL